MQIFWICVTVLVKCSLPSMVNKMCSIRTEQHHGDVFLETLPSNDSRADVGPSVLALYRRDVQLANRLVIPLHVHPTTHAT